MTNHGNESADLEYVEEKVTECLVGLTEMNEEEARNAAQEEIYDEQ